MSLPADFWNQFMMVENMDPSHVIENTNIFSTPQTPDVKGKLTNRKHLINPIIYSLSDFTKLAACYCPCLCTTGCATLLSL